jgi:hypothetical protein
MDESAITFPEARRGPLQADPVLKRVLHNVALTEEEEIECTSCLERVPVFVDLQLAGVAVATAMPEIHLHLVQCGDCFEEYEALRDLVALEPAGSLLDTATLLQQREER